MLIKKLLVLMEKWGLVLLVLCLHVAFMLAVGEGMRPLAGKDALTLWDSLLETLTSDSDSAEGWAKIMHLMVNATLAWAGVRVYMTTAGLKWDNFAARFLARSHVIIIAG